jgi:hypothetical protein
MGPFELAVIAIVIIGGSITKIATTQMKTKGVADSAKIQELERRIQALETQPGPNVNVKALQERVHVLEDIVTADDFELQKKFRQLEQ